MALRHAASVAVQAHNILREIGLQHAVREPIRIYGDNLAANKLTKDRFIVESWVHVPAYTLTTSLGFVFPIAGSATSAPSAPATAGIGCSPFLIALIIR